MAEAIPKCGAGLVLVSSLPASPPSLIQLVPTEGRTDHGTPLLMPELTDRRLAGSLRARSRRQKGLAQMPSKAELEQMARDLAADIEQRTGRKVKSVEVTWTRTEQVTHKSNTSRTQESR